MRDLIKKFAKPLVVYILLGAAVVLAGLYEILYISDFKNDFDLGIVISFVFLLAALAIAIINKNKAAVLGIFTFLAGFIAIYQLCQGFKYLSYSSGEFENNEVGIGLADLFIFLSSLFIAIGAFSFLIAKFFLVNKKEIVVTVSVLGFLFASFMALAAFITFLAMNYYGDGDWYFCLYDLYRIILPLAFILTGTYTKKVNE